MSNPEFITVRLDVTFRYAAFQDINTHWLGQIKGNVGSLAASLSDTDTSLTLNAAVHLPAGSMLLLDQEPMTVSADVNNSTTVPVSRGATQTSPLGSNSIPTAIPASHAAQTVVAVMTFNTPWVKAAEEALGPWALNIGVQLGPRSASYQSQVTGTVLGTS